MLLAEPSIIRKDELAIMEIIQSIATRNPCYKAGKKITVKGIMLEGVGCPQPSAKVFAHNWNRENCEGRCAHAFVDANDGNVVQLLPWNHKGWHSGRHPVTKNSANYTHIGIKICEPTQIRYKKKDCMVLVGDKDAAIAATRRTYESSVELLAILCGLFNLDPMKDIVSQKEGNIQGLCSYRNDVELLWETLELDYTMDGLRKEVVYKMKLNEAEVAKEMTEFSKREHIVPDPVPELISCVPEKLDIVEERSDKVEKKVCKIQIDIDNLRIRSSPTVGNNATGFYTGTGVFEIVEIQNGNGSNTGWGKLADGSGWVSLDYVKML